MTDSNLITAADFTAQFKERETNMTDLCYASMLVSDDIELIVAGTNFMTAQLEFSRVLRERGIKTIEI